MDLLSIFKGGRYFDKSIAPKCDYCQYGKRARDGNKVLCEKRGLMDREYSCSKFIYSPLKRIPVKQLRFVGSLADEDIYIESVSEREEKEGAKKAEDANKTENAKSENKTAENNSHADENKSAENNSTAAADSSPAAAKAEAETVAEEKAAPAPEQRYVGLHEAPGPAIPAEPTEEEKNYVGLHEATPGDKND